MGDAAAAALPLQKVSNTTDGSCFPYGCPNSLWYNGQIECYERPKIYAMLSYSLPDLVSPPSTSYACEGSTLTLSCPRPGLALRVIRANFGRFSVAVCNEDVRANLSVNCMAPRTLRIMQNR